MSTDYTGIQCDFCAMVCFKSRTFGRKAIGLTLVTPRPLIDGHQFVSESALCRLADCL